MRRQHLFDYEFTVNSLLLDRLEEAGMSDQTEPAWRLFAHLLAAQEVWRARMEGRQSTVGIWPVPDPVFCRNLLESNRIGYRELLVRADQARTECTYQDSKGTTHTSSVEEILEHLLLHGAYHRGQIASRLREVGIDPPRTDYIVWTRGLLP